MAYSNKINNGNDRKVIRTTDERTSSRSIGSTARSGGMGRSGGPTISAPSTITGSTDQTVFAPTVQRGSGNKLPENYQQNTKWYRGATPTTRETLARISLIGMLDRQSGETAMSLFSNLQQDRTSLFYNPYTQYTNRAIDNLAALGIDVSNINDDWFTANRGLMQYYVPTANTNGLSSTMTNKRSSPEQKAAYYYNQLMMAEEDTKKAENEWAALQKEVSYKATQSDRNMSDEEILASINWKKYPTLAKMDSTRKSGTPMELNRAVGYSEDAIYGTIWAARNNGGTGNAYQDMINSVTGVGNQWKRNDALAAKLDPDSEQYAPYSVGSTMDTERQYFGVPSFDAHWLKNNKWMLESGTDEDKKHYIKVAEAEEVTAEAEEQLKKLKEQIDAKLEKKKYDPEAVKKSLHILLESGDYNTLVKMDKTRKQGYNIMNLTRAVDYRLEDMEKYIDEKCAEHNAAEVKDDIEYAESIEEAAAGTTEEPAAEEEQLSKDFLGPDDNAYMPDVALVADMSGAPVPIGQFGRGNIDLDNRPVVRNADGTISTERSFSVNIDGKEVLLPTVINGKIVSEEEAIEHYKKTGEHLGIFDTVEEAEEYAEALHQRQEKRYGETGKKFPKELMLASSGGTRVQPTDAARAAMSETEKAIVAEKNKTLSDGIDMAEGAFTPTEKEYMDAAGSVSMDIISQSLNRVKAAGLSGAKNVAKTLGKRTIQNHFTTVLDTTKTMFDYNQNEEKLAALRFQESELASKLSGLEYVGMEVEQDPESKFSKDGRTYRVGLTMTPDGYAVDWIDDITGRNEYGINDPDEWNALVESPEIDSIIKQETERAALIDEQNQAGVVLTDEQIADQRRLREIRLQIEDAETYQRENEQAYKEAEEQFEKDHKEVRMTLLSNRVLGLDSSDIERAEAVVGYMTQFADYEATQWYAYNPSQMYANAIAAGEDREAVLAAAKQGNDELTTELETAKLVKQYLSDNGMKVPADYMNGLDRHIAKLERDQKDYEYFSLIQNKDFAEIARKGREMEYNSRPIGILGDRRNIDQYYADMENGDAMGGLVYGLKALTAGKNSIMTQEEKDIYYYLLGSGREKDAKQYVSFLIDPTYGVLNVRSQQKNAEALGESIRSGFGGFTGNNIMAVILSPVSAISALGNYAYNAITGSEYGAYNPLLMINNLRTATREESAKAIDEYYTARFGKDSWQQKLAQAGYEIVTNRADSAMNMIAFSGLFGGLFSGSEGFLADAGRELISSMPMGLSASADAATEAKKKGATDAQAYGVAAVTLLAETVTEAVSLENMSDAFKIGEEVTSGTVKEFLKNWLTKAGISEAFGESMSNIIENYADEKIMGELSDHADRVWEYRLKGYDPEEAEYRARKDELNSVLRTALISYISPGLDIISTASGRYQYYRELTRDRQQSGDNRSMLEIMRGEKKKEAPENPAIARKPFETTEKKPAAKAPAETTAEAGPATETVPEAGTETATDAQTKNVVSMEILQSAADSAKTTQTAAVAAALTPENVDTPNVGILAEAAAVRLGRVFGEGTDVRSAVQDIMAGATVGKVQPISVQQALTNAALSENSKAFNVTQSDVFKSLPPDAKAAMLASTVEKDMNNQTVINDIKDSLKAHRINAETKGMIADGGLKDAQPAVDAARDAARNSRLAESMLEDRQAETEAAQQGVDAAREEVQRDPIAGGPVMTAALNKLNSASAVEQEYQQKAQTSQRTEQDAREKADQAVNDKMTEIRQEATDRVNQQMAAEEQAQAEAQAAAEEQAKVDEENRVRQEDADNASDADFDAYVEEFYPDATEEERQHVREIWDRMRNSGQQQQQQQTPEQMSEEDQANRSKFLKSVGKKLGVNIEEVDGMEFGANGSYDRDTNTLRLNKNATIGDKLYAILGHELTHITEQAGEYNKLADSILRILYGNDVSYQGVLDEMKAGRLNSPLAQAVLRRRGTYEQATGLSYENDYYLQEVVADGMGSILKYDAEHPERQQNLINRLVADDPSTARKIMDSIKRFLKQLVGAKGAWQTDMQNTVDLFEKALKSAQANPVKAKQKAPIRFSGTVKGKTTVVRMADGSIHRFNQTADTIAKSVLKDYSTGETASNMSSRLQEVRNDWIAGRTEDAITKLMKTAEEMAANAGLSSKTRATSDLAKAMNGYFGQYILLGKAEAESIAKTYGSVTKANDILANAGVKARMTESDKTGMALDEVYSGGYNDDPAQRALQLALGEDETPHMEDVIGMLSSSNDPHQAFLDAYDEGAGITEKDLSIDIFNRLVDDVLASNRIDDQQSGDQFQDIAKEYEGTPIGEAAKSPVKKFSITAPVELREDGLMAVHNLSIDNLIGNLRKGGFASPSIAVVPTKRNWSQYGNVSVFFGANTIDPKQGNNLYAGDAFTPTLGAGTYNTAEEALEAQRQQPARRIEVDENMREMSRMLDSYKKIRSIDEARTKAYSKNNYVAPIWKHTEAAKNLVAEHVLRESGLDPSDPSFPQEAFEALDEMKSHAEYGMFLAIEEAEAKETLSDDDLREILTRNINEAARELDPEFEGFDFGNDDALFNEFKDLYNYVEENPIQSGMQESKPDRIIGLDEIECVEIPADAPQDLVNELGQYLPEEKIHVYDPMTLGDRARVANEIKTTVPGVRFSIGDDLTGQAQPITDQNGNETDVEELRGGTVVLDTTRYSLNSYTPEEQAATRAALLSVRDANGKKLYTPEQVDKYMADSLGIASMIAADRARLDYDVTDPEKSMVKPNADYGASIDASTLCAKRLLYQGTFDAIQHALPNTPLLPGDLIKLANMMREGGYETPCGICYVESRRRTLGMETDKWLKNYDGEYKPRIEEVTTSDGLEKLRKEHKQAYDDFIEAMKNLNQRNPKVVQLRTDYRGEIRAMSDAAVQKAIDHGGLRLQSFSDFETPHLLDMIQVVYDMASKGLTSQAYTKVPNFAWAFGDTGVKINLSEIANGDGYTIADGRTFKDIASLPYEEAKKLISLSYDDVEGMKHSEAMALRNRYGKNVGTIMVGKSDAHIIAAMADGEIDFIIPFHRSGWTKNERKLMETLVGYQDYTNDQNEKKIRSRKPNGKGYRTVPAAKSHIKNFEPVGEKSANGKGRNGYWDFSKSGKENAEAYLKMCAEDGRVPKFSRFLVDNGDGSFSLPQGDDYRSTAIREGYWKTLIDFKMYDNDGKTGAPQMPVTPNVNMDQARRILDEYSLDRNGIRRENNNTLPVAQTVVDKFVEEYKRDHPNVRYSLPDDQLYVAAVERGDDDTANQMAFETDLENTEGEETSYGSRKKFSLRVTDPQELDFLNNQETITTYKTMQLIDGKLYPPMAAVVAGNTEDYSELGSWEKATEHPELIKTDKKGKTQFTLNKGGGKGQLAARYNPYMHSSNLMINDQFTGAYDRPNLVTVECEVPVSESDGAYHAEYAKDSTGWHGWHTGPIAGALRREKGIERQVFLSRWIKPVRIVPDSEVAAHYADLVDGTDIRVSDNVVYPSLLSELEKAGVPIENSGRVPGREIRYSLPDDSVLERQIREYLANGGSLRTNAPQQQQTQMEGVPAPRADRPQKQRQYGYERAENIPLWHDETIKHLKENSQYDPDTNREQVNRAFDWIKSHANENDETGYYGAIAELESPDFNFASSDGQARMIVTTAMASVKAHDGDASALNDEKRLNDLFNRQGTDIAQALQARKIYFMLTPQTKRHSFQTEIDKINNDYKKKGKKTRVELPNELMEELVNAKTDEELDAALAKARKNIASQMPANWKEKLQAWRMFAMLGNFRTHFRNFDGNLIFTPVVGIKNKVGAVIEAATHQQTRTKTLGLASTEARAFALEDSKQMESILRGEKKYSEGSKIQQERKMFGTGKGILSKSLGKVVQKLYDLNGNMLEKEDWVFLKRHYRNALAGYMTANKLTAADMKGETLDKARAYAVNEAQKATYRDANSIADWLNNVKNPVGKFLVNAVLPFKKTPANILKRGIEYSPVGIINALTHAQRQFNRGEITVNDLIDKWASGLTGTGIMILGAILSGMGAATGGLDDDDDEFEALKGNQKYAINPGKAINSILGVKLFGEDVSYTVDWAAPPSMPFFVGAAIMDTYKNRSDITITGVLDALAGITEPVFNLSMLDGVNNMLNVSQYSTKNAITQVGESILTNYATSFVPTLVGQVARTMDTTRRKSYVESGAKLSTIQYAIEGLENKIPYLSTSNIPYRDVWGNADTSGMIEALIENTISPGYANRIKNDPVVNELQRIYNADGVTDENRKAVVPKSASKTIGSTKLNAEQYDKYVVTRGQTARETLEALMGSPLWQISDDNTRAKMVNEAWTYANQIGQHEVTGRKLDGWVLESRTSGNVVNNIVSRVADANKGDYISGYGLELAKAIDDDDGETYDICLQALEDADATRAEIKKPITNYFKPIYQKAYEDDDDELMAEIREKLIETGLGYESKTFKSWISDEDEDEFENSRWLTTP